MELFTIIGILFLKTFFSVPLNILFWVILLIIYYQYRKLAATEKKLFGRSRTIVSKQVINSMLYGVIGGFAASILLFLLGVSLTDIGIIYILPLALFLMFVKMRYLCFAYAGGIIALLSTSLNLFPAAVAFLENTFLEGLLHIHVPGLLSLVAVLHFTESILIRYSGHLNPSPVYIKTPEGKIVGGFTLQAFWPLPIVGLVAAAALQLPISGETLAMPDWWPLLGTEWSRMAGEEIVFLMLPLVAWLGYGDIAISTFPKEKTRISSRNLAGYSIILMILAVLTVHLPWLLFPAALFSPLGHEIVIRLGNRREFNGDYIFTSVGKGVKVLDTFPDTPAFKAFNSGDVIISVTGEEVNSLQDFWAALHNYYPFIHLEVKNLEGKVRKEIISLPSRDLSKLGVILVPEKPPAYAELKY